MRTYAPGRNGTIDERLLAAARSDNEDELLRIFNDPEPFEINYQDGFVHRVPPDFHPPSQFRFYRLGNTGA